MRSGMMTAVKARENGKGNEVPDIEDAVPTSTLQRGDAEGIRSALLDWYDANHRVLPWRRNKWSKIAAVIERNNSSTADGAGGGKRDATGFDVALSYWKGVEDSGPPPDIPTQQLAYGVWVSEVMSQQTQIERVAEYWGRWVRKWPTLAFLAAASQEDVNQVWAGLGYYRRARYLLDGAKFMEEKLSGELPSTAGELRAIPGIGPYTAAAVASIAFGEREAAVDGNVLRVVTRLCLITGDPAKGEPARQCATVAGDLLCPERPGDHNQAMMELGATVCTPRAPMCTSCPVVSWCRALAREKREARRAAAQFLAPPSAAAKATKKDGDGDAAAPFKVTDLPEKAKKAAPREEEVAVRVVEARLMRDEAGAASGKSAFLLIQRPADGLLSGLWEFPSAPVPSGATAASRCTAANDLIESISIDPDIAKAARGGGDSLGKITHVFSHIRLTMHVEHKVVRVRHLPCCGAGGGKAQGKDSGAAVRWVLAEDMVAEGLTSGVKKVYDLVVASSRASSKGSKGKVAASFCEAEEKGKVKRKRT